MLPTKTQLTIIDIFASSFAKAGGMEALTGDAYDRADRLHFELVYAVDHFPCHDTAMAAVAVHVPNFNY